MHSCLRDGIFFDTLDGISDLPCSPLYLANRFYVKRSSCRDRLLISHRSPESSMSKAWRQLTSCCSWDTRGPQKTTSTIPEESCGLVDCSWQLAWGKNIIIITIITFAFNQTGIKHAKTNPPGAIFTWNIHHDNESLLAARVKKTLSDWSPMLNQWRMPKCLRAWGSISTTLSVILKKITRIIWLIILDYSQSQILLALLHATWKKFKNAILCRQAFWFFYKFIGF